MRLAKAHGLGNDFLLVADQDVPAEFGPWARRLCDRHTGAGADGVLRYRVAADGVHMRLINADGGEVELSGNGVRCLAAYVRHKGWLSERHTVWTPAGPRPVTVRGGGPRYTIETGLGAPALASDAIPCALSPASPQVLDHPLVAAGESVRVTAVSMGNPHCSVFLDGTVADDALVARLGPALETHPFFPKRTNVEFVTVLDRGALRVRFWERGVGPTLASGTGSAGAFVAAVLRGAVDRRARAICDGGTLEMEWPEGGDVTQTGEVEILFEGDWLV